MHHSVAMSPSSRRILRALGIGFGILAGIAVVVIAGFLLIFGLTFGDPCGTVGPCLEVSESSHGVSILDPDNPMVRIPFEATFSDFALTEATSYVEIDYGFSWADVDARPTTPDIVFETSDGVYQVTETRDACVEICVGHGELVMSWPAGLESGSLLVDWTLRAVASFNVDPKGGDPTLTVDAPPSPVLLRGFVGGFGREQDTEYAMSAARLTVTELSDDSGELRLSWQDRGTGEFDHQEQVVEWPSGETTMGSGSAVEVSLRDLCRPDCVLDLIASWIDRPGTSVNLAGNEEQQPISAGGWMVLGDADAQFRLDHVPVPSIPSPAVERSVQLQPGESRDLRLVITSPSATTSPQPVGLVTADVQAIGFRADESGRVTMAIGNAELQLGSNFPRTSEPHHQTPVPLTCEVGGCWVETTLSLASTAGNPVTVDVSITVDVFHPEYDNGIVDLDFGDDS